jgi:hypothetical protein
MRSNTVDNLTIVFVGTEENDQGHAPQFDMYVKKYETPCATAGSGFRFPTKEEAEAAAARAIEYFNVHGKFPNMCEAY